MLTDLAQYLGTWEDDLNTDIMDKSYDADLSQFIADAWESLEVLKYLKFVGYDFIERESMVDINQHMFRRNSKAPKKERHKLKMVNPTRCGVFTAHMKISLEEVDPKTQSVVLKEKMIHKDMLIPIPDEDGMYLINGKKYYMIYQLTEKSTYNTNNSNVVKSLMPMVISRGSIEKADTRGNSYLLPVYTTFVYKRNNPILLYMFANEGVSVSLMDLRVSSVVKLVEEDSEDDKCLYFQLSPKCFIEVNKELFDKYTFVKSVVGAMCEILNNKTDFSALDNREQFVRRLTPSGTIEKGMDNLTSFNRMLDKTTKNILRMNEYHREDVYAVLRWAMFEYDALRMKDNMNLKNKRLRCMEYVSSLLTLEFSNKLTRLINLGSKVTMDQIVDMFRFAGDILLTKMHSSGILRFDESINDMNFFSKFKWTLKGPHSLGTKNENNIVTKYRGIHPSYIYNLDLLTCGNSDPGTSGIISPFCKMDSLYFDEKGEPDDFVFDFMRDVKRVLAESGTNTLEIEFDTPDDYYRIISAAKKFSEENIHVYGTSKDDITIVLKREDDMVAEHLREDDNGTDDGSLVVSTMEE